MDGERLVLLLETGAISAVHECIEPSPLCVIKWTLNVSIRGYKNVKTWKEVEHSNYEFRINFHKLLLPCRFLSVYVFTTLCRYHLGFSMELDVFVYTEALYLWGVNVLPQLEPSWNFISGRWMSPLDFTSSLSKQFLFLCPFKRFYIYLLMYLNSTVAEDKCPCWRANIRTFGFKRTSNYDVRIDIKGQ